MPTPLVPDGRPLTGRWLRLNLLGEDDLAELYPVLADPAVYQQGYVMHHRPESLEDSVELARRTFLRGQGQADGNGGGRTVYAIGGSENSALLMGLPVHRTKVLVYVISGSLAGLAAVLYTSRLGTAQNITGIGWELDAIAACFIGGAAVTGGVGKVTGAMVGGLIMGVMSNGMQLMGIDQSVQQVVKGLVLLLAVAFDVYNKRRAGAAR